MTARTYLDMLELYVVPQLPAGTIYQQDGAPPHYALEVRNFLNDNFPGQWIGRGSETIAWPPRSPDLTPLDFFYGDSLRIKFTVHQWLTSMI